MDKLVTSGAGSILLPLAAGVASAATPAMARGVGGAATMMGATHRMAEDAREREQWRKFQEAYTQRQRPGQATPTSIPNPAVGGLTNAPPSGPRLGDVMGLLPPKEFGRMVPTLMSGDIQRELQGERLKHAETLQDRQLRAQRGLTETTQAGATSRQQASFDFQKAEKALDRKLQIALKQADYGAMKPGQVQSLLMSYEKLYATKEEQLRFEAATGMPGAAMDLLELQREKETKLGPLRRRLEGLLGGPGGAGGAGNQQDPFGIR